MSEKDKNKEKPKLNFGDKHNSNGFSNPANRHKAGRPKKNRLSELLLGELGFTPKPSEIRQTELAIANMSMDNLYKVIDEKDGDKYAAFVVSLANTIIKEYKAGKSDTVLRILERTAGKPMQSLDIKHEVSGSVDISKLTDEQKASLLNTLTELNLDNDD